jgi:hypothetical protein
MLKIYAQILLFSFCCKERMFQGECVFLGGNCVYILSKINSTQICIIIKLRWVCDKRNKYFDLKGAKKLIIWAFLLRRNFGKIWRKITIENVHKKYDFSFVYSVENILNPTPFTVKWSVPKGWMLVINRQ